MFIKAETAIDLFSIITASTQGLKTLTPQRPLLVEDRVENWLVRGTPYTDHSLKLQFCFSYVLLSKSTARVAGIGSFGRAILTDTQARYWHSIMTDVEFKHVFGPRTHFEPGGEELAKNLVFYKVAYGGMINTAADALAFANSIAGCTKKDPYAARSARLLDDLWIIQDARRSTIMTIARRDCETIMS